MQHRNLILTALVTLLAAGPVAMAQTAAPATPAQPTASPAHAAAPAWRHDGMPSLARMHDMRGMRDMHHDHDVGVIGDLHSLEHLYRQNGRSKEMVAVYQNVLAKSQDPRVRDYAYHHLARLQAQPADVDQAIATLKKGLDENLANEAKLRAEREQMRAAWQAHHAKSAAAAPTAATPAAQ